MTDKKKKSKIVLEQIQIASMLVSLFLFNSFILLFLHLNCLHISGNSNSGSIIVRNPLKNKGLSFTQEERNQHNLAGILPVGHISLDLKVKNLMKNLRSKSTDLEKYEYLHMIQDIEEALFFAALIQHLEELMPIVYTPTVGQACLKWSQIYRQTVRGLYLSIKDTGNIENILATHISNDVAVIVVTDGERILGLGDLGVNGMGIPIGKLALYCAAGGIPPERVLPIHIDVGTDNQALWLDEMYAGIKQARVRGGPYDAFINEFVIACQSRFGKHVLIQFEDFGNTNAFKLLRQHRHTATCFNDDIQGTASVVLAGFISSLPLVFPEHAEMHGIQIKDNNNNNSDLSSSLSSLHHLIGHHRVVFYGAGEAAVGIADLLSAEMVRVFKGALTEEEARSRIWLIDSKGLVENSRSNLAEHKLPYAHVLPDNIKNELHSLESNGMIHLEAVVRSLKPTALIGVSAQGGAFTEQVVKAMVDVTKDITFPVDTSSNSNNNNNNNKKSEGRIRPLVMALSNPTSKSECTAEEAYDWANGDIVFMSGSPFSPVSLPLNDNNSNDNNNINDNNSDNNKELEVDDGHSMTLQPLQPTLNFIPGQANNAYIFPGLGLAMVSIHASSVTDLDFIVAAHALAETVTVQDLKNGRGFPPLSRLREVSLHIAAVTALHVAREGRSLLPRTHLPTTLEEAMLLCAKHQYNPHKAYNTN